VKVAGEEREGKKREGPLAGNGREEERHGTNGL